MTGKWVLRACTCIALAAAPAAAQPFPPALPAEPAPTFTLQAVTEFAQVTPGQRFLVAADIRVAPDCLYYAPDPGTSDGFAPIKAGMAVEAPGLTPGEPLWPPAHAHKYTLFGKSMVNNVYEGRTIAYVPIDVPPDTPAGTRVITLRPLGQTCGHDACARVDGLAATVAVMVGPEQVISPQWRDDPALAQGVRAARSAGAASPQSAPAPGLSLLPMTSEFTVLAGIGLALLAGLILNIMPCVLPVIPLKVLAIVEHARRSRRLFAAMGLAFAGGIILFFAGVAAVNLVLRAASGPRSLDWGEHFQSMPFRIGLALLMVALAANMLGLYHVVLRRWMVLAIAGLLALTVLVSVGCCAFAMESWWVKGPVLMLATAVLLLILLAVRRLISGGRDWGPYISAIGSGLLTGLLSTPCSFATLAAALAWGQAQPPWLGTVTILLIGVGMASPYLLLITIPQLMFLVPKPGRWTVLFRQSMGFMLLLVVVWLLSTNSSDAYAFWVTAYAVVLAFCLWVWGTWAQPGTPLGHAVAARVLALALAVWAGLYMLKPPQPPAVSAAPYDAAVMAEARQQGRVAVLDFTASWCLTCKYVDQVIYDNPAVAAELRARGVLVMRADVSQALVPADRLRQELGEAIPVTVVYPPGEGMPIRLRGIFSAQDLYRAIDQAAATTSRPRLP